MGAKDQGADATTGHWITIPRTLCFITHGDDILLLKRAAHKRVFPGRYNGVGGHIERDEDILTGAIREMQEETSLSLTDVRFRGVIHVDAGVASSGIMVFVVTAVATTRDFTDSDEGTLHWVPRDTVLDLPLVEDLPILLPLLFDDANTAPFFAHASYDNDDNLRLVFAAQNGAE